MQTIKLNNNIIIPIIGTGTNTFGKENKDYMGVINNNTSELLDALNAGYTLIDTAIAYRNESVVALGIKQSGIDRSKLFITSKIPADEVYTKDEESIRNAVESSLKALDTEVIDLYLLHRPLEKVEDNVRVWKELEKYVKKGILKSIGVSNFKVDQLAYLLEHCEIKPAVNQIESHPGLWNDDIIDYCLANGVIPEAWSPLKRIPEASMEVLKTLGLKYNKTWAQIVLRYQIERNVIVIPKSHNKERQIENLNIFDFSLSDEDKQLIKTL